MRAVLLVLMLMILGEEALTQSGGLRLYAGVSNAKNRILAITPNGTSHSGFHFGGDGRLNSGRMFFIVGGRYTKLDLIATDEANYFGPVTNHSILSGRVGIGWHLIQFSEEFSIRGKVLGQLDSNISYDDDLLLAPYDSLVDASAGATLGLGVQFKFLTFDLEYEYGLVNQYSQQKETKVDVISASLGFFF